MTGDFTPGLTSTAGERLGLAEDHIRYLQTVLDRVARERDVAVAELAYLQRVGSVLNMKRRHP